MVRARIAGLAMGCSSPLALAFLVELTGGIRLGRGGTQSPPADPIPSLLLVAAGIVLVRHLVLRRPSLRDRLIARRARRREPWLVDRPLGAASGREWLIAGRDGRRDRLGDAGPDRVITGVPDRGDPFFSMWRLGWDRASARPRTDALWNANIFYPAHQHVRVSDATLLPASSRRRCSGSACRWPWSTDLYVVSFFAAGLTMFLLARAVTGATARRRCSPACSSRSIRTGSRRTATSRCRGCS